MEEIEEEYYRESKRDRRIRDRMRMIARGRRYRLQENWWWAVSKHRRESAEMHGRLYHDHLKMCSCDVCCNPRHSGYSKGQIKLTMQERRANHRPKHRKKLEKELDF